MKLDRPKYWTADPEKGPSGTWDIVELKFDGIWGTGVIRDEKMSIFSRTGVLKETRDVPGAPDAIILGEFMFGSNWSIRTGRSGEFYLFDCIEFGGEDVRLASLSHRRDLMMEFILRLSDEKKSMVSAVAQFPASSWQELWKVRIQHDGFEGLVFKNLRDSYGVPWERMKRVPTMDYIVIHVNEGRGRNVGSAGSILGGLIIDDVVRGVCNVDLRDIQSRQWMWDHREELVGRVFEAKGNDVFSSGALRHPKFMQWRDDKLASECVWEANSLEEIG